MYTRYRKVVKSINNLIKCVNICKILISLLYYQLSNSKPVLNYNMTNSLNLLSDNNKKNIRSIISNNDKKKIRLANIDNNKEDIRLTNINKQKLATINLIF